MDESTTTPRSLEDRLDSAAAGWKPEQGDKLTGVVIDVDSRETEYGLYPIVTLMTSSGEEVAIHAFHTVLKGEFAKRAPRLGEELGVKYLGKSDKGYEGYRVVWGEPDPNHRNRVDWDAIEAEAQAEVAQLGIDEIEGVESETAPATPAPDEDIPF